MQSDEEPVVLRLQSPDAVQHWAAILVPSGARVSVGEVMQMPRAGLSELPHKASTLLNGGGGDRVGVLPSSDGVDGGKKVSTSSEGGVGGSGTGGKGDEDGMHDAGSGPAGGDTGGGEGGNGVATGADAGGTGGEPDGGGGTGGGDKGGVGVGGEGSGGGGDGGSSGGGGEGLDS